MDSTYMQMEKVRGMGGKPKGEIPSPRPLEEQPKQSLESMGYGDSTQKCGNCEHMDAGSSMCKLAGEQCEPGGHCGSWEGSEMQEEPEEPEEE